MISTLLIGTDSPLPANFSCKRSVYTRRRVMSTKPQTRPLPAAGRGVQTPYAVPPLNGPVLGLRSELARSALDSGLDAAPVSLEKVPSYDAHHRAKHALLRRYMDVARRTLELAQRFDVLGKLRSPGQRGTGPSRRVMDDG